LGFCERIPLVGCFAVPLQSQIGVVADALALIVGFSQFSLGDGVTLLGGVFEARQCPKGLVWEDSDRQIADRTTLRLRAAELRREAISNWPDATRHNLDGDAAHFSATSQERRERS
jgi:hypothetical protein